nr:hypothetical protein CFP56_01220 [Quercus suber]
MYSMASSATDLESTLTSISPATDDEAEALSTVQHLLLPILHYFEETPVRAIVLSVAALWSTCLIIYLMVAQRAAAKASRGAKMNKRWIRVCLEILTLVLWIAGIVCAALLAAEYGAIIFIGGAELKLAWTAVKPLVKDTLERVANTLTSDDGPMVRQLDIVNDIFNIGAVSILAVVAAGICGFVSVWSCLAACCISGKPKTKASQLENGQQDQLVPMLGDRSNLTLSPQPSPLVVNVNGFPTPPMREYRGYTGL